MAGTKSVFPAAPIVAVALCFGAGALSATEYGATHLVFQKTTKMKKVAASLYLSFLDQTVKNDSPEAPRRVRCAVATSGKGGPVPAIGKLIVHLRGEVADSSIPWQSRSLTESIDERGEARFEDEAILGLVADANADGAEPDLFRIDFDGGKGKKVTQATVDCVHESVE